jgi:hypothetical protein
MATVSLPHTFSSGGTIFASEHNNNFSTIYNDYNGNITDINVASNAAIANSKLNLASITQAITTSGSFSTTGDTNLGDGADTLTINCSSGITYTPAATWTFTAGQTVSGTWTDLGSVTTCDINGGTIDGATVTVTAAELNIGSTNQGDIFYDNGTDDVTRLTPGTDGQFLKTQGAAANPVWDSASGFGNVIFHYQAATSIQGDDSGEIRSSSLADTSATGQYRYLAMDASGSFSTVLTGKFTKIVGIDTITVHAEVWHSAGTGLAKFDINGLNVTLTGTGTTPSFKTDTIDVTSLSDGTTYDITISLRNSGSTGQLGYLGTTFLMGSS